MRMRASLFVAVAAAVGMAACVAVANATTTAATSSSYRRCSVYKAAGLRSGVYVMRGRVSCSTARAILLGVAEGKGRYINNGYAYNSYTRYHGWACAGNMGIDICQYGRRPVRQPKREVAGSVCAYNSRCPRLMPRDGL